MDKKSLLKNVFVFSGLDETLLSQISGLLKEARFSPRGTIFSQDMKADAFYIVISGEVMISKKLGPGREKTLAVLGPGSIFGEMAFFSDSPRTADAVALSESELWKIERSDFLKFVNDEPKAGLRITSGLLQVAMDRLEQTSRELTTIYRTGNIISSGRKLADILKDILEELMLAIPDAGGGAVYIYNEFNAEYDPVAAPAGASELPSDGPLTGILKEKPGGAILNTPEEAALAGDGVFGKTSSLLASPIIKGESLQGFILLWNSGKKGAFRAGQLLLTATVSSQLAEAVENIRHRQEELDRRRLNNARQSY